MTTSLITKEELQYFLHSAEEVLHKTLPSIATLLKEWREEKEVTTVVVWHQISRFRLAIIELHMLLSVFEPNSFQPITRKLCGVSGVLSGFMEKKFNVNGLPSTRQHEIATIACLHMIHASFAIRHHFHRNWKEIKEELDNLSSSL